MRFKRLVSVIILILILPAVLSGCGENKIKENLAGHLTAYFFDVGQADSTLLVFPDGTSMLIDAGNRNDGAHIADYIRRLGIKDLDYLVCTHPHDDHIGGMKEIFNQLNVGTVCIPLIPDEFKPTTKIYESFNKDIKNEGSRLLELTAKTVIFEKQDSNVAVVSPAENSVYSDLNNYSLTLLINCFTNTLLLMADAEEPCERDMLKLGINLDADILKVGHHGSENASTAEFLIDASPKVAIISSGAGNSYGHPNKGALTRLSAVGAKVYRTDTVGTIIAKCYDGGFNIETSTDIMLDGDR